jgi:hypothetical protein
MNDHGSISDDLLLGAAEIAVELFGADETRFRKRVYHLCNGTKRPIPHFRVGSKLAARRSTLRAWVSEQEQLAAR